VIPVTFCTVLLNLLPIGKDGGGAGAADLDAGLLAGALGDGLAETLGDGLAETLGDGLAETLGCTVESAAKP